MPNEAPAQQLLHLVFGGELTRLDSVEFKDLEDLDIVGIALRAPHRDADAVLRGLGRHP